MKAFLIGDIKAFMSGLLSGTLFKDWEFRSLDMGLIVRIHLDGKRNLSYLPESERQDQTEYIHWDEIQSKVKLLIQGGSTPTFIHMTMAIPPQRMKDVVSDSVESYQLNIRFETVDESGKAAPRLTLITGVANRTFSMDKNPERVWDSKVPEYFTKKGLPIREAD
ncbi:MAG: hypothetical protein J5589_00860 [Firmicutes bacterium]|nr:hypothetical protein [Bacillota bacterium]